MFCRDYQIAGTGQEARVAIQCRINGRQLLLHKDLSTLQVGLPDLSS